MLLRGKRVATLRPHFASTTSAHTMLHGFGAPSTPIFTRSGAWMGQVWHHELSQVQMTKYKATDGCTLLIPLSNDTNEQQHKKKKRQLMEFGQRASVDLIVLTLDLHDAFFGF